MTEAGNPPKTKTGGFPASLESAIPPRFPHSHRPCGCYIGFKIQGPKAKPERRSLSSAPVPFPFRLILQLEKTGRLPRVRKSGGAQFVAARRNLCETVVRMREAIMRILNILCGIAVLLTSLAFAHLLHHYYFIGASHDDVHNPAFLAGMAAGVFVGIFSFVVGCRLPTRGRK